MNESSQLGDRLRPTGWPVGSFSTYAEAQRAVDTLSDQSFPVDKLTIVGVDLMQVEKVTGRLTWGRVLMGGAASGAWMGLFFGLLLGLVYEDWLAPLTIGLLMGAIFGMVLAAVPYAMSQGKRDFVSATQIVAGHYDVLCDPDQAARARDMIESMGPAAPSAGFQPRPNGAGVQGGAQTGNGSDSNGWEANSSDGSASR